MEISIDETDQKLARLGYERRGTAGLVRLMAETGCPSAPCACPAHRKYPLQFRPGPAAEAWRLWRGHPPGGGPGNPIIQLAGYDVYYDPSTPETVERFGKNLEKAVHMAAKAGVTMGFETMETEFMNTVEKAMNYVNRVNSTYLNVYPDLEILPTRPRPTGLRWPATCAPERAIWSPCI